MVVENEARRPERAPFEAMGLTRPRRDPVAARTEGSVGSRTARKLERLAAAPVVRRVVLDPLISWGWRRYLVDGTTPSFAYRAMRTSFLTPPTSCWGRVEGRAQRESPRLNISANPPGLVAAGIEDHLLATLRRDGLVVLPSLLPAATCDEISHRARSAICTLVDPSDEESARARFDASMLRSIRYDISEDDLLASSSIQQLMADESLLGLIQEYLGAAPVQDLVAGWWSAPGSGSRARAAQLFHFDLDRPRFLKLFVYLTDVDHDTGPHVFVRGTHRALPRQFRADRRYSDAEVVAQFGSALVRASGPRGTVFLADTRALHKGEPVLHGHRLVVQMEWSSSLFGAPYNRPLFHAVTPSLANAMRRFPSVYRRFEVTQPPTAGLPRIQREEVDLMQGRSTEEPR